MMRSLFEKTCNDEIVGRIIQLTQKSSAQWGKMDVSQMVAHCQVPLKVAYGELKLKKNWIGFLFGNMAKRKMVNDQPFTRNLPTDKHFIVKEHASLENEKEQLIKLVQRFTKLGPAGLSNEPHPFFGKLTTHEWDLLAWKHLDHHLKQFGV